MQKKILFTLSILGLSMFVVPSKIFSDAFSIHGSLTQPFALEGGNIAATYYGEKFLIGYSHGANLNFHASGGVALNDAEKRQKLEVNLPYTTGLSIGYLITKNLDIRMEFKEHYYRVRSTTTPEDLAVSQEFGLRTYLPVLDTQGLWLPSQNTNLSFTEATLEKAVAARLLYNADYGFPRQRAKYRTRSVGFGLYYRYFFLGGDEGWMLEPSIRYWPNVWADSEVRYAFENQFGVLGLHKAHDQGLFVNVSFGYYKNL